MRICSVHIYASAPAYIYVHYAFVHILYVIAGTDLGKILGGEGSLLAVALFCQRLPFTRWSTKKTTIKANFTAP